MKFYIKSVAHNHVLCTKCGLALRLQTNAYDEDKQRSGCSINYGFTLICPKCVREPVLARPFTLEES